MLFDEKRRQGKWHRKSFDAKVDVKLNGDLVDVRFEEEPNCKSPAKSKLVSSYLMKVEQQSLDD